MKLGLPITITVTFGMLGFASGLAGIAMGQQTDPLEFCRETLSADPQDRYCTGYVAGYTRGINSGGRPGTFAAYGPVLVLPDNWRGAAGMDGADEQPLFYVPTNPRSLEPGAPNAGQYLYKPYTLEEFAGSNLAEQYGVKGLNQDDWKSLFKSYQSGGVDALEKAAPEMAIEGLEGGFGNKGDVLLIPPQSAS